MAASVRAVIQAAPLSRMLRLKAVRSRRSVAPDLGGEADPASIQHAAVEVVGDGAVRPCPAGRYVACGGMGMCMSIGEVFPDYLRGRP